MTIIVSPSRQARGSTLLAALLAALLPTGFAEGQLVVDQGGGGTHTTIQSAINAATHGQEILVMPGTYFENINFGGKRIALRGSDPLDLDVVESTIIDGLAQGSVVTIASGEGLGTVLEGFTIRNGSAWLGGGVYCDGGSAPEILHNIITANFSDSHGTGIHCGGGAAPLIRFNTIIDNFGRGRGAGIFCENSAAQILDNAISLNTTMDSGGGGIHLGIGTDGARVADNDIFHNTALFGGGLHIEEAAPLIERNRIWGNLGTPRAGGLSIINGASPIVRSNVIAGNRANFAAAIDLNNASPLIHYNTIIGNRAADAAVILAINGTVAELIGNIIAFNDRGIAVHALPGTLITVDRNCLFANPDGNFEGPLTLGLDNLFADPLLIDPGHWEEGGGPPGGGDLELEAFLVGDGGAGGESTYRLRPDRERFQIDVWGFPPNASYQITLNGTLVASVFVNGAGDGSMEFDSNDGNFPADFPEVAVCDQVDVGGIAAGPLDLEIGGGNCTGEVWVPGDEHLLPESPALDHHEAWAGTAGATDLDGQSRPFGPLIDIGADERVPTGTADFNGDHLVDMSDFAEFQNCFGSIDLSDCVPGDFDDNGVIEPTDYATLRTLLQGP